MEVVVVVVVVVVGIVVETAAPDWKAVREGVTNP